MTRKSYRAFVVRDENWLDVTMGCGVSQLEAIIRAIASFDLADWSKLHIDIVVDDEEDGE